MSYPKKLYTILSTVLLIIIGISLLSSLKPPGGILAGRIGWTDDPVDKISRNELAEYPSLEEAIHRADTCLGVHSTEQTRCSNQEGMKIVKRFNAKHSGNLYWFHLEIEGQQYQVSIIFVQNPPPTA